MPISNGLALGLIIIPILAILIIIHELGHFFAARSVGIKVEEFGLGIPPRAKGWRWKGVLWSLNWVPFGGFVRVKGEDGKDFSEGSMHTKGPWQRGFFLAAGPFMNFVAAVVLCVVMVGFQGITNDTESVYVNRVEEQSPATDAGWQPGDVIVAVNGTEIHSTGELSTAINQFLDQTVSVTVLRAGERVETTVEPRSNPPDGQGATGIEIAVGAQSVVQISQVDPGSTAELAGMLDGDRITAIGGVEVESEAQVGALLNQAVGNAVVLTVVRDGQTLDLTVNVPLPTVIITGVGTDSAASSALLYTGDQLTSIDGIPVVDAISFRDALWAANGRIVPIGYLRDGREGTLQLGVPAFGEADNPLEVIGLNARVQNTYDAIGVNGLITPTYERVPLTQVVPEGWSQFTTFMSITFDGLQQIATEGVDRDQISGPVGMGQVTSELLSESVVPAWFTVTFIMVIISVGLGVMNLLPIPALDGGRLLFVFIEIIRGGKRISPEKEGLVHLVGMVFLLGLMFLVAFGDVSRLLDGRSMLP
ncbi:MAG: site-2 protease family protein [Thermomicrobiales bacterium]